MKKYFMLTVALFALSFTAQAQELLRVETVEDTAGAVKVPERIYDDAELDEHPSFPGGSEALTVWLNENMQRPAEIANDGEVMISFVVEKDGKLSNICCMQPFDPACDKAAIFAVRAMPNWIPGKKDNTVVRTKYVLTIPFKK